jgi:hypothetical protein
MRETQAIIERVRRVGAGWQHLALAVDPSLEQTQPGQVLLVRVDETWDPYLREVWIPVDFDDEEGLLIVEQPLGRNFSPGDVVSIIGPIGEAFPIKRDIQHLLLVAQDYAPIRLFFLMNHALRTGVNVTLVLTGDAQEMYPINLLPPALEVIQSGIATSWADQDQTFLWAEQVFVITSPALMDDYYAMLLHAAQKSRHALPEGYLHGIFDLPIPCGTGACMACMVRSRDGNRLACVDGAAFDLARIKFG